jgi:aminomethyltransferase
MIDRGIPRKGYKLLKNNAIVGQVTSGTQSPSLKIGIGLAYVTNDFAQCGTNLSLLVRDKELKCKIVDSPFYKKGTLKK